MKEFPKFTPVIHVASVPTGHVPPSKRCDQCAVARQEATETSVRKRLKKRADEKSAAETEPEPEVQLES